MKYPTYFLGHFIDLWGIFLKFWGTFYLVYIDNKSINNFFFVLKTGAGGCCEIPAGCLLAPLQVYMFGGITMGTSIFISIFIFLDHCSQWVAQYLFLYLFPWIIVHNG